LFLLVDGLVPLSMNGGGATTGEPSFHIWNQVYKVERPDTILLSDRGFHVCGDWFDQAAG
jgi:hypothetical protein